MKIIDNVQQGSLDWLNLRLGRPTMSRAKDLLAGGRGKTRQSYIMDLVAERLSGDPANTFSSLDMERGTFLEDFAMRAVEMKLQTKVRRVGFVLQDDERIGASPDGLIGDDSGVEIKCPKPRQHIRNILADGLNDYRAQAQGCMWVCERDTWYIVSFCPWVKQFPLYIKRINRDAGVINKLSKSAIAAADEIDEYVEIAMRYDRPSEINALAESARDAWDNVISGELIGATDAA